jgi:GxxExxY protein
MNEEITKKIIGAAIEVHQLLGPGLLESIYEEALCHEFSLRHISFERQVEIDVVYKDCEIKGQRLVPKRQVIFNVGLIYMKRTIPMFDLALLELMYIIIWRIY